MINLDRLKRIEDICSKTGIDFNIFLNSVDEVLQNKIKAKLTPNNQWFECGVRDINRYWKFIEEITGNRWTYDEVLVWYKELRSPSDTREEVSPSLRYEVITRDKSTCQKCGRKAPQVEVEVDHILPWGCGGPTVLYNLHTLCRDCNRGKSMKYYEGN